MKNKKINIIRKKLDKLDLKMLSIIKKRSFLVNKILEQKQFKNQIVDNKRINVTMLFGTRENAGVEPQDMLEAAELRRATSKPVLESLDLETGKMLEKVA